MDPALRSIVTALEARGLDHEALQAAVTRAEETGRPLRSVLVEDHVVTDYELVSAVADAYGVDVVDLSTFPVERGAMSRIPLVMARRHQMVPIATTDTTVTVAVVDPGNVLALDDIQAASGLTVIPMVATFEDVRRLLVRIERENADLEEAAAEIVASEGPAQGDQLTGLNDDSVVVRYVNGLLESAISARASDIHLEPSEFDLKIRLRIDGVLHAVDTVPQGIQAALISRLKIISGLDITERRVPQNGRITMEIGQRGVDLRVATLPTVWGEKVVLRILDTGGVDLDLRKLGFTDRNYERFAASFRKPHGMVLVTGPTGSGKSTTLYAALTEIARPEVNVITVEDPVEYRIDGINQVQVNVKAGLTFAAVLPAILRSDPDIVLVGEIRDSTTAQLAIEAALTGHLVLSTLHTNDAPSAMTRLVEIGIEPFLVSSSLSAVMAQRLARRLCAWCKESYAPEQSALTAARWPVLDIPAPKELWRPVGCRQCARTGFRGRVAIIEVMPVSEEIDRLTVAHAPAAEIAKVASAEGMFPLRHDGLRKAALGVTTLEEVLRVTV
jgi:type IV pilus assembly protein PilB